MSTDRELLEAAAKAAGVALYWSDDDPECDWVQGAYPRIPDYKVLEKWTWKVWNPLTDDGDALRLAVKLGVNGPFRINWGYGAVSTEIPAEKCVSLSCEDMEESDPLAATRRAIVRAAAEIGKGLRPFPTEEEIREEWT